MPVVTIQLFHGKKNLSDLLVQQQAEVQASKFAIEGLHKENKLRLQLHILQDSQAKEHRRDVE